MDVAYEERISGVSNLRNSEFMVNLEHDILFNRVKGELETAMPSLSKRDIRTLQKGLTRHFESRFARRKGPPKYGNLNKGFTEAQIQAFFLGIEKPKYHLLFSYMAYLGLRIGEVVKVNIQDIDFTTRELRLRSEKTKSLDLLIIPLTLFQQTQLFIEQNREEIDRAQGYIFFKDIDRKQRAEHYIEANYARRVFRDYVMRANLDEIYDTSQESEGKKVRNLHLLTTHSLRHYAITKFAKMTNGNILLSSKFARHREPHTTLTYIHTDKKELYEQIDKAFLEAKF